MSAAGEAQADAEAALATYTKCREEASQIARTASWKASRADDLLAKGKQMQEDLKALFQEADDERTEANTLQADADAKEQEATEAEAQMKQKAEAAAEAKSKAEDAAAELAAFEAKDDDDEGCGDESEESELDEGEESEEEEDREESVEEDETPCRRQGRRR